jgi:hypothetical protein
MKTNVSLIAVYLLVLCACVRALPNTQPNSQSSTGPYEQGRVIKVQEQGVATGSYWGGTDAPLREPVDQYQITLQVGDTVYTCRYAAATGSDLSWLTERTRDVRVEKESILLKRIGGEEEVCPIESKEKR